MEKYKDVKLYQVGGSVRDDILKLEHMIDFSKPLTKDLDFVVEGLTFEELPDFISSLDKTILHIHEKFFVIKAKDKITGICEDYAICRKDTYSQRLTLPEITPGTIYEDLERRDFTMNAVAQDITTGKFIDPHHGIKDIGNRIIRCVGNPKERFMEDCVRIIRCLRFHIKYDFTIDEEIWNTLRDLNHKQDLILAFNEIPRNRIVNELNRLFDTDPIKSIQVLAKLDDDILKAILGDSRFKIRT